ncbi:FAD/NAD(P)-binding domain-containing protein [Mycena vitilis]|nr:FAD/NAD(P)-binding domain-containing protein [Mycena vitilis]
MADSLPSSTEVCIVGAGPSGLACAVGLAARNIPFVIVDALEVGHTSSRAVLIQASALEALGASDARLPEELITTGNLCKTCTIIDPCERELFSLRFEDIAPYTKYAFTLLIPQHMVERALRESVQRSGNSIHWRKRVTEVKEVADGAQYELGFESGEVLTARYVVAADGSKSSMRSFAGIQFLDPHTNKEAVPSHNDSSFVVADVFLSTPVPASTPRDHPQIMVGGGGVLLTAPLRDPSCASADNLFRLYLGVPGTPPRTPDAAYLQAILDARGPGSQSKQRTVPQIIKVLESSRYRTRSALADRFVHRANGGAYILLVGDAAHKHGPAGGQGMNMGICDGCEIAEAIDEHRTAALAGKAHSSGDSSIMTAYCTRRRAIARKIIDMVDQMSKLENGAPGWGSSARATLLWMVFKMPFVNRMVAWNLSGLGHAKKR